MAEMNHLFAVDNRAVELCRSRLDDKTIPWVLQENWQFGAAALPRLFGGGG